MTGYTDIFKFKRTESTDGVDDHRISKNILSPRVSAATCGNLLAQ